MSSARLRFGLFRLVGIGVLLSACRSDATMKSPEIPSDDVNGPSRDNAPAQTDSLRYTLRTVSGGYETWANVTLANRGARPISFARCNLQSTTPMWGLRRTGADSTAKAFIGPAWACVGGVPTGQLAPGDSIVVRVWLGSTTSPYANPPIQPAERVGRFRVELTLCKAPVAESGDCEWLPQAERQSNAFEVVFPH